MSENGKRSSRLFISLPENLRKLAEADIENRRLSSKINRFLEICYANGGSVDSLHIRRTEIRGEIARLEAELLSLQAQEEAIHETRAQENHIHRAETTFRTHVKAAMGHPEIKWFQWLSPTRADVKPIGMKRAKQIIKEEAGVDL